MTSSRNVKQLRCSKSEREDLGGERKFMPLTFTLISNVHLEEDMVVRESAFSATTEGVAEARDEGHP